MSSHPLNVCPLGNLLSTPNTPSPASLGLFSVLPHALLVRILDTLASPPTPPLRAVAALCAFGTTSRAARAFAADDDLWRRLAFRQFGARAAPAYTCSWRHTYLLLVGARRGGAGRVEGRGAAVVYSDVLFHKWRCLTAEVSPEWLAVDTVPRVSVRDTDAAAFRVQFEEQGVPAVITGVVEEWPAYKQWTQGGLEERFGEVLFHAGGYEIPLKDYFIYCKAIEGRDDQPLYIFDKHFADKAAALTDEYSVPPYFEEDLFKVLGEERRPDYRWLIIGPARSGSSFHKDPNATSAWNAVISGAKKWVLFPPDCAPPGVYPSGDEGDVTTPVSITEWFLNYYDSEEVRRCGGVECVVKAGEVMFVPMGWWHCVLNVETSVAITQNYVSAANVASVAAWLRQRPEQISGCRSEEQARFLSDNFARMVVEEFPELRGKLCTYIGESDHDEEESQDFKRPKICLWDSLQSCASKKYHLPSSGGIAELKTSEPAAFSFGFQSGLA